MPIPILSCLRRAPQFSIALLLLASTSSAQGDSPSANRLIAYPINGQELDQRPENLVPVYRQSVDLAVSDKSFQIGYRENSLRQDGFWNAELMINDDNDVGINLRLMRVGQVVGTRARLGVGLGAYAVFFDDSNQDVLALAICGSAQYDLPTNPPTTANLEISIAPDISTFKDGKDLLDILLRVEAEVSASAVAFVGARIFDAETDFDDDFTHELQVGVRLSL